MTRRDDVTPDRQEVIETLRLDRAKTSLQRTKIHSLTGLIALALIGIGAWVLLGNKIVISDEMKVMALSMIGFGIVSSPYAIALVKKLWNPPQCFVIRVNLTKPIPIRVFTGSPDLWDDVDIVSGEPESFAVGNKMVYIVTDFKHVDDIAPDSELAAHVEDHHEGMVATGSWLGEASDAEIATERRRIEENRRRNNIWARIGEKLYAKFEKIANDVEMRHHKTMTDHSMDQAIFEGADPVKDEIMQAVPELEQVDDGQTVAEIVEDEIDRQMRELNTSDAERPENGGESR